MAQQTDTQMILEVGLINFNTFKIGYAPSVDRKLLY